MSITLDYSMVCESPRMSPAKCIDLAFYMRCVKDCPWGRLGFVYITAFITKLFQRIQKNIQVWVSLIFTQILGPLSGQAPALYGSFDA